MVYLLLDRMKTNVSIQLTSEFSNTPIEFSSGRCRLGGDYNDFFKGVLKKYNKYCNFIMKVNKVKKSTSRKKSSPFWQGKMICKHASCQCTVSIKIPPDQKTLQMTFSGKIIHIRKREVDNLKGNREDKLKEKLLNMPNLTPFDFHRPILTAITLQQATGEMVGQHQKFSHKLSLNVVDLWLHKKWKALYLR